MFKKIASARWGDLDLDLIQTAFGYQVRYGLEVKPRREVLIDAFEDFAACLSHGTKANGEPDR